jgi:hypothetical protein
VSYRTGGAGLPAPGGVEVPLYSAAPEAARAGIHPENLKQGANMIVASGYVEANGLNNLDKVLNELRTRGIDINEIKEEKVLFLFERNNINSLRAELDSLNNIDFIKDVYLSYYSLERTRPF